jgi:class 3 adenylate cyclase
VIERTRTFLSLDIVGSTDALRRLGLRYAMVLETLRRVMARTARDHGGAVVDAVGDAMLFVFDRADDAVLAALVGQAAIAAVPDEIVIDVRMGVHTGAVWQRKRRFIGLAINKTTRVTDVGAAGEIVLSQEALDAVGRRIHDRFVFVRRTIPKLKDFDDEVVYELRLLPEWPCDEVGTVASVV